MVTVQVITGDCLDVLRTLPDESVHTCVTSPPYWGLRDYGTAEWEGGDTTCAHIVGPAVSTSSTLGGGKQPGVVMPFRGDCGKCGATRIDRQLGLESTPEEYVSRMVEVFREVRRVLRDDGTVWANFGDSYNAAGRDGHGTRQGFKQGTNRASAEGADHTRPSAPALKPKDLAGIPWSVAFALRADGWYLRQDIIWSKPNPMPESVTDRCTKAHEYIFLLAKSQTYYYDAEAIAEQAVLPPHERDRSVRMGDKSGVTGNHKQGADAIICDGTRNKRSVWTVTTKPFSDAHFATFPPDLIEPCIKAGCPEKCCPQCGAPWERITERVFDAESAQEIMSRRNVKEYIKQTNHNLSGQELARLTTKNHLGWQPTCDHDLPPIAGTVLDPFFGAGTTGLVADRLQRNCVGIELNPQYADMARSRIRGDAPLFAEVA